MSSTPGSYAEARNVDVKHLVHLPDSVCYEQAAAMMLKGLTAQYLLRQTYRVQPGDAILVHAAAGGVGQILCQWGKHLGATVIATVGSPAKAEIAKACGADHVINYSQEDFAARVGEITKGAKCAVVYDGVGKTTFPGLARLPEAVWRVRELRLGLGPVEAFNLGTPRPEGLAVRHPADAVHLPRRPRAAGDDGQGAVRGRRLRRRQGRHLRPAPLAEAARVHRDLEGRRTTASIVLILK